MEGQIKSWAKHFLQLLNRPLPTEHADIDPAEHQLDIDCDPPLKEEIRKSIMTLNGESAGPMIYQLKL